MRSRALCLVDDVAGRGGEDPLHRLAAPEDERRVADREAQTWLPARLPARQPEETTLVDAAHHEADLVRVPRDQQLRPLPADVRQQIAHFRAPDTLGTPGPPLRQPGHHPVFLTGRAGQFHQFAQQFV